MEPTGPWANGLSGHRTHDVGRRLRILVVEDHEDTAVSLAMLLEMFGHEVRVASDGPSALGAAGEIHPDVVLLDIALPGMDGWQVAEHLRAQTTAKRPLIVALTGYARPADRDRSQQAGIDLHLVKPVDPQFLDKVVRTQAANGSRRELPREPIRDPNAVPSLALQACTGLAVRRELPL